MSPPLPRLLSTISQGWGGLVDWFRFVGRTLIRPIPAACVLLAFVGVFVVNGFLGLNFGPHWDEWYHVKGMGSCVQRLSLLPDAVSYGGFYFSFGFPVVIADQWRNILGMLKDLATQPPRLDVAAYPSVIAFKAGAAALLGTGAYVIRVRAIFMGISALSILWVYLAALRCWPRRYGTALAAAAFMAFSFEFGYHSRWLAIDGPLTQFCALELFLFCGAWRARTRLGYVLWFCAAAAASGAAFACKLTGLFAFLPIFATPFLHPGVSGFWRRVGVVAMGGTVFLFVSFAFSPAFFLDPLNFLHVIRGGTADYNTMGPTYPHYVGFFENFWRLVMWAVVMLPSPFPAVAAAFSAITVVGLVRLLRRETRMTLAWMTFIASFTLIFTHNHLLIVRQYLMFMPFVALCFARGSGLLWNFLAMKSSRAAQVFAAFLVITIGANAAFASHRAWHVESDSAITVEDDAADDLLRHKRPIRMSQLVLDRLRARLGKAYVCRPANVKDTTITHFLASHAEHWWMANRFGSFRNVYGAAEVNLGVYTLWVGRLSGLRIVEVQMSEMVAVGRNMAADSDCFPAGQEPPPAPVLPLPPPPAPAVP